MKLFNLIANLAVGVSVISAAAITQVSNYGGTATSKAQMWVYVPDTVKSDALVVVIHSCQSTAQSYSRNSKIPSPNSGTCWDVSSKSSLSHNGGGDSNAIANMITYALDKYMLNATRVFVTGGSSGAMMSNVLAATYPEMISAVSLYSGVAAGCFVGSGVDQWNNACSGGQSTATPEKWGDTARAMYPGYNGTRPRMQIWHGSADTTLAPQNYQEELKQWTNIFGVSMTATDEKKDTPDKGYTMSDYGPNVEGIYAQGVGHSVPSHLAASEAWFALP
ncbi:acetylxylan esterase-like protein 1 precursor [Mollisia scopiformis]|uniref:Acetylxylan esteras-like protein 1 n=1 Tax=Mollisia scopiformis TaxID=149040 RepID=A0A132B9S9_MOLSC|nr:acetylxylan esterase-like protein 1 precursor [Mollisia scopiformis]KUJ08427.1 acetylxylan esteras-like protein 1 precursor [Mollisia scopiformis]